MRRDVHIQNDSGGFSVLAADAVDAIIEDQRADDASFVVAHKAMLIELVGDDSMPIRIVVDEPLTDDEEAQWLARSSWRLDTSDGRLLAMGGFDPDVLASWKDDAGEHEDGSGVAAFTAAPGSWRVDVYAHVGSMNGRAILREAGEMPGASFHADSGDVIGLLVHVTPLQHEMGDPPEGGWFKPDENARIPTTFPIGLRSDVPLGIEHPEPQQPIADRIIPIIEVWSGDTLTPVDGGPVPIAIADLYLLHWMAALASDTPPRFELWVEPKGSWTPPTPTPDFAVVSKGRGTIAIGPVENSSGWHLWWTSRGVAAALPGIPDSSTLDFATLCIPDADDVERNAAVGRSLYSGSTSEGSWWISHAAPRVAHDVLAQAISFVRDLAIDGRMRVHEGAERDAFILAASAFRERFGSQWPVKV